MNKPVTFVGLDVHKETIVIALANSGEPGEVREYGKIAHTPAAVQSAVASWQNRAENDASATKLARAAMGSTGS
jgi:hypothetical protein